MVGWGEGGTSRKRKDEIDGHEKGNEEKWFFGLGCHLGLVGEVFEGLEAEPCVTKAAIPTSGKQ